MTPIVLSGFAGTGKTTIAPLVASRLGVPWVDTDAELTRRTGRSVSELWGALGETAFREREADVIGELLEGSTPYVLSLGGGAVTVRATRHRLVDRAFLVTLTSKPDTLLRRLGDLGDRPVLASRDRVGRLNELLRERASAYAECHLTLSTDDTSPEVAAEKIVEEARRDRVVVPLGQRSYVVEVVRDEPAKVTEALARLSPSSLVVVTDENVHAARGPALLPFLEHVGVPITHVTLAPGEVHKTLASVEAIWTAGIGHVDRGGVVVGFGGGVVGDLAGFAASTMLRGLRVVQAPTSLLAMVDASVGGKTGFDLPAGKNLVGTFHQPSAVLVDLAHLTTLPRREFLSGLAEVVKTALVCDVELWSELESQAEALVAGDLSALVPVVRRTIALKARLVRDDETDTGQRALLNLGHTLGHALEAAGGYLRHRHGEAVAIGLVLECHAAERLAIAPPGLTERVRCLLVRMHLPTTVSAAELRHAEPLIATDKKRARGDVVLALPTDLGAASLKTVSARDLVSAAIGACRG